MAKSSQFLPAPPVTSMLSSALPSVSSYTFDFTISYFDVLATAQKATYELSVDIYNDTDSEVLVTYTYDTPILYTVINQVSSVNIETLD